MLGTVEACSSGEPVVSHFEAHLAAHPLDLPAQWFRANLADWAALRHPRWGLTMPVALLHLSTGPPAPEEGPVSAESTPTARSPHPPVVGLWAGPSPPVAQPQLQPLPQGALSLESSAELLCIPGESP